MNNSLPYRVYAFLFGGTAMITQIVLLREFLSVFYGNELVIGVLLANWMALTGAGAALGSLLAKMLLTGRTIPTGQCGSILKIMVALIQGLAMHYWLLLIAVLPITSLWLLDLLRNVILPTGSMAGLAQIIGTSFLLLLPFCIVCGSGFTMLSALSSQEKNENLISNVYAWESIGGMAGGAAFSIALLCSFDAVAILKAVLWINVIGAGFLSSRFAGIRRYATALCIAALSVPFVLPGNYGLRQLLFRDQTLLSFQDTPYGALAVTKHEEQVSFYEDNMLLFSTNDAVSREEAVHYAMIQHPRPERVLLIGGGVSGGLEEILKYGVTRIDYVEINRRLVEAAGSYTGFRPDPRVRIIHDDARRFVRKTTARYDVLLVNVPDPTTAALNRYYTTEFFADLTRITTPGAIVACSALSDLDYYGGDARQINSTIVNTLRASFPHVLVVPGMKNFFLASDAPLDIGIAHRITQRRIDNVYVNQYYLDDAVLKERSDAILKGVLPGAPVNRDFAPIAYYRQLQLWLSQFRTGWSVLPTVLGLLLIFFFTRLNTVTAGICAGGFSASSLEVVLLIAFQILYGYVYQMLSVIITLFMTGLAVGALLMKKSVLKPSMKLFAFTQWAVSGTAVIVTLFLLVSRVHDISEAVIQSGFYILAFVVAVVIGAEFALASILSEGRIATIASRLYSIDLIGSALGALLTAAFLIPALGVLNACLVIAGVNVITGWIAYGKNGRQVSSEK
jgi:spermidine synthase